MSWLTDLVNIEADVSSNVEFGTKKEQNSTINNTNDSRQYIDNDNSSYSQNIIIGDNNSMSASQMNSPIAETSSSPSLSPSTEQGQATTKKEVATTGGETESVAENVSDNAVGIVLLGGAGYLAYKYFKTTKPSSKK